ncbi:MAG: LamG domain-containing protein [Candidatus Aenigmatarchaeota archaeon]
MKAVSPLVSLVLTVLLITVAIAIVITSIKPSFDRMTDSNTLNEAMQNLELIDSTIKQVSSESQGSKRTISLTITDGEYKVNGVKELIEFNYDLKSDFSIEGTIGNVKFERSPELLEYFNIYQENTNASPPWNIVSGAWKIESGQYSGENGIAYNNYGQISYFSLEGKIINKAGAKGEIFGVPGSPIDLVGYWTFDESSGTVAYDYSGNSNKCTLMDETGSCGGNGCPTWVSGRSGYALSFDGVGDYVDCGNDNSLNFYDRDSTVEAWIKYSGQQKSYEELIVGKTGFNTGLIAFQDKLYFTIYNDTLDAHSVSFTIHDFNRWYHAVGVFSRTNGMLYLFVDGELKDSKNFYGNPISLSTRPLRIGGADLGSNYYFNGIIDEIRIYNRTLTSNEIKSEYELSQKKLYDNGKTDTISAKTNLTIVLSSPEGHVHFDDITIKTNKKTMKLVVPYAQIDLNGTLRLVKGNYKVIIEHKGTNPNSNKPIIELTVA